MVAIGTRGAYIRHKIAQRAQAARHRARHQHGALCRNATSLAARRGEVWEDGSSHPTKPLVWNNTANPAY